MKEKVKKYHYEWLAYTENLWDGRIVLSRGKSKSIVAMEAKNANEGEFVIKKYRVYNQ